MGGEGMETRIPVTKLLYLLCCGVVASVSLLSSGPAVGNE